MPRFYKAKIIPHDAHVPNQGTHYSKKCCKVTNFLPNNIFSKKQFFFVLSFFCQNRLNLEFFNFNQLK